MEEHQRKALSLFLALSVLHESELVAYYYYKHIYKEPCMTSALTRDAWMRELLTGHPIRCVNAFRTSQSVFKKLCDDLHANYGLVPSDRISVFEKVDIFVYTLALGLSNRDVSERFQRSGKTISRAFHDVLQAITGRANGFRGLARDYVKPNDTTFKFIPRYIFNDERYMPYFKAIETRSMNFPHPSQGRYYLVDKGYPDRKGYLVPYPKITYHQSQFENELPTNAEEAFNRAHCSLRSCIEISFGVLKKRWRLLKRMPKFSINTQIDVIVAAFTLHNYIQKNSNEDLLFNFIENNPDYDLNEELEDAHETNSSDATYTNTSSEKKKVRNNIANLIWNGSH
ncbi:unnamed protein product [Cuscuta europaea]|uniref:DDE Tnp4 domain-containing protein n=1 Tax=Cuscuta europaea TaxID=41803 RepID=A0A9P0ZUT5_CUSEU|nr:unnamed protein product [Cuscuta europaea]